jgi:hypothetical protein
MINLTREEAEELFKLLGDADIYPQCEELYKAIETKLSEPEPEPVLRGTDYEAAFYEDWNAGKVRRVSDGKRMVPEREWVGLTDEEIEDIRLEYHYADGAVKVGYERAIEAKLKEKAQLKENSTSERNIQTSDNKNAESSQQ